MTKIGVVKIHSYQNMINEIFLKVGQAVGVHVVLLVIEHSLWKTRHKYADADLIRFSEEGIELEALAQLDSDKAEAIAEEFITMFVATLGRLVGKQLARQLIHQLDDEFTLED